MATRLITSHAVSRGFSFSSTSVPKAARMLASRLRLASGDWGERSRIQAGLNPETRARVAAAAPAFDERLQFGIGRGHVDLHADQLVAALAILGLETAILEPQDLA